MPHPKASRARLSDADVLAIRDAVSTGRATQRALARLYGVTPSTISSIVSGATWKHLPLPAPSPRPLPGRPARDGSLSMSQVAALLGIRYWDVRHLVASDTIPSYWQNRGRNRGTRIRRADVDAYLLDRNRHPLL